MDRLNEKSPKRLRQNEGRDAPGRGRLVREEGPRHTVVACGAFSLSASPCASEAPRAREARGSGPVHATAWVRMAVGLCGSRWPVMTRFVVAPSSLRSLDAVGMSRQVRRAGDSGRIGFRDCWQRRAEGTKGQGAPRYVAACEGPHLPVRRPLFSALTGLRETCS